MSSSLLSNAFQERFWKRFILAEPHFIDWSRRDSLGVLEVSSGKICFTLSSSLQVLDIYCESRGFPSWMRCPTLSVLVIRNQSFLAGAPEVSKLSLAGIGNFFQLKNTFPGLDEVRIESTFQAKRDELVWRSLETQGEQGERVWDHFLGTLRHRRHFSSFVRDAGGVSKMLVKKLVIPFKLLDEAKLAELKDMADEVVDLDVAPRFVEIEI